ncbi:signal peptidase I [Bacillus mexicanus]|uniref:signal peptidase I n=1 Tax=Bacillus mexicanus TaxID=2834415 RepID=UPI003D1B8ACF
MENENTQFEIKKSKKDNAKEWIISIIVSLIIVALLKIFIIGFAVVDGPSMENTIQDGDRVFYAKMVKPKKDDIVIVKTKDGTKIIKRVIGLGGDHIEIKDGTLYVNGKKKTEKYIKEPMVEENYDITVPKGEIFVMGDNRNVSADSRMFGTFNDDEYLGKVVLEVFHQFKAY